MAVRVRLFASIREAAGTSEVSVEGGALRDVLAGLCERFGEPFTSRLASASLLVDGQPIRPSKDVVVADGAELAVLPPVSGGAARL